MKASEILALSKAGYNAQQIALIDAELRSEAAPKQEQPKHEEAPAPKQEQPKQEEAPAPKQEPPKQEPASLPGVEDIMAQLNKLTTAVYAGAINGSRQPEEQTPEDIIAQIIRPDEKNL
jgi:hypothetical protein